MIQRSTRAILLGVAVFLVAALMVACVPQATEPLPTRTPMPTFTPPPPAEEAPVDADALATAQAEEAAPTQAPQQPAPQEPAQQEPDQPAPDEQQEEPAPAAPAPADTPTPQPAAAEVVINSTINVRGGPGTNYNIIGSANAGQRFPVTGRNPEATWWQINFNGQAGWVFGDLVTPQNTQAIAVASNIPAPPPPTPTPIPPPPTPVPPPPADPQPADPQPEEPQPEEPAPAPPPSQDFPFALGEGVGSCDPNPGNTYFEGFVRDSNNNPVNGVCIHIHFYEPRGTKCSGCDGLGDGNWGFSPFGGPLPEGQQIPVEIFVVPCEGEMPMGGQTAQSGFGNLTPQSPKWTRLVTSSEQCTGITFYRR